ncbi:protein mono-ADP-ribosyltransferase PARP12b [Betta splendens]|uniref:Protein mono-ADP-ribosyltransferase PARP12b n=1 Tax=Betta splendens TaxID=158456 RepID=A0A9W2Y0X3_BETSP|nr:protein mono-ADP-ribosyltransferase PARP12b [Betta splendens]
MSVYNREILIATRILCSSGGAMQLQQLQWELLQRCSASHEDILYVIRRCPRFLLVPGPEGDDTVVAKTSLRLCRNYGLGKRCGGCEQLHLCRFFIYGNCRFGKGRKPCKFSHNIQSEQNSRLLRECTLHELSEDDLFLLLLQNDPSLLPKVCAHYNKGSPPHGCCTFQDSCTKVHLCQHLIQGDCVFGSKCKRQHAIDEPRRLQLEEKGLSRDVIRKLPSIYRNIHHIDAASDDSTPTEVQPCAATTDNNICLHFIRNNCRFHNECRQVHFHLPYKWEVFDAGTWTDLQHMEDMERDFCDPSKTQSCGARPVDFLTMTRGSQGVRRLSTVSSVTKPPHYLLTTEWRWFYKGDQENWVEYGDMDEKQRTTSQTSRTLEERYLSDRTAEVKVLKGHREYVISFKDMYQRNLKHKTKRKVRRRPRFVSVAEVKLVSVEKPETHVVLVN